MVQSDTAAALRSSTPTIVRLRRVFSASLMIAGVIALSETCIVCAQQGGTVWGSFGGMKGKDSPIAPPAQQSKPAVPMPATGKKATRGDKGKFWEMGRSIAITAMLNGDSRFHISEVNNNYNEAADIAQIYSLPLKLPPKRTGSTINDTNASMDWAINGCKKQCSDLDWQFNEVAVRLVELGTKVTFMRYYYVTSGNQRYLADDTSQCLKLYGPICFPDRIWEPLSKAIDRKASAKEVREAVIKMDGAVYDYFDPNKPAPRD